jgi:ferredoxin-NADP reductase
LSLFTKTTMAFVRMREIEDGAHAFTFAPAKPLAFVAGQHGLLRIAGVKGRRAFSLASAPEDPEVMIATRLQSRSDFKLALAALKPGDPVTLNGPILDFTLRGTPDDVVFLAQGIGITPFRSILRHIAAAGVRKRTHLVHVGGSGDPPFRSETESLASTSLYVGDRDANTPAV